MSNRVKHEFLSGVIEGIASRVNSPEELIDEIKKMLPGVKIVSAVKIGGNVEEGEGNDQEDDKSNCKEGECECSQCRFNKALRKLERESEKEDDRMFLLAHKEIKNKFGDNINEYIDFLATIAAGKKEIFNTMQKAIAEYGCSCVTMAATKKIIKDLKV